MNFIPPHQSCKPFLVQRRLMLFAQIAISLFCTISYDVAHSQSETFQPDYDIKNQLKLQTLQSSFNGNNQYVDIRVSNPTVWRVKDYSLTLFLYSSTSLTSWESAAADLREPGKYQEDYSFDNLPILEPESTQDIRLSLERNKSEMAVKRIVCEFAGTPLTDRYSKRSLKVKPVNLFSITISHSSLVRLEEYRDGKLVGSVTADEYLDKVKKPFFIEITSSCNLSKQSDRYIEIRNEKNKAEPSVRYLVLKVEKNQFSPDIYEVALSNYDGTIPKSFVSGQIEYSHEYIKVSEITLREGLKHERVQVIYYDN